MTSIINTANLHNTFGKIVGLTKLLQNPSINLFDGKIAWKSINMAIGQDFLYKLPNNKIKPFIFSCFALTTDGKLCYPDSHSGYLIADKCLNATPNEKYADYQTLVFARAISDAIIIGAKSFIAEDNNYLPKISIKDFQNDRVMHKKSISPHTIIFCQDINNIDLNAQIFKDDTYSVTIVIINPITNKNLHSSFTYLDIKKINNKDYLDKNTYIYLDSVDKMYDLILWFKKIGFNIILNESPWFHHKLLEFKLLDELWLNYAGSYIGGSTTFLGQNQNSFTTNNRIGSEILELYHLNYNFLYTRQLISYEKI